ncbi:hypothetical protein DXC92_20970 [Clostridiales bacterium TF09-2AC]|nr:hypothetical protein DXC92_20970 [Clostridiales bacterium TF09-2AC]
MRRNNVVKLGAFALALTLITTSMMGSTLAKYVSEAEGTGTVAIAKWGVTPKDIEGNDISGSTFDFTLAGTKKKNDNVQADVVAPGDTGEIKYVIEDKGTEVGYTCKVELDTSQLDSDIGAVIKFYTSDDFSAASIVKDNKVANKTVGADATDAADRGLEGSIYWRWETDTDTADTGLGMTPPANQKFTLKLSAEQIIPVTPTP